MKRIAALGGLIWTAHVWAAPPANDLCAGAQVVPSTTLPVLSNPVNLTDATDAGDPSSRSCGTTASRSVWFSFTPATTGQHVVSTCNDFAPGTTLPDTVLAVYSTAAGCSGPFTELASGCSDDACGASGSLSTVVVNMIAGTTYFIVAWKDGTTAPSVGAADVQIRVGTPGAAPNDTCSGATALPLDRPLRGATYGATTLAQDNYRLDAGACFAGIGQSPAAGLGRDVVFAFTPSETTRYSIRAKDHASFVNPMLYMSATCPAGSSATPVPMCVAASNRNSVAEELSCVQLTQGTTYYVYADDEAFNLGSSFEIEANKCVLEVEPNNTVAQANALTCGVTGHMNPAGDTDMFGLAASTGRVFAMVDGVAAASSDFDLRVVTNANTLEYDDLDNAPLFGSLSANVAGTPLTGTGYLAVTHYSGSAAEPYRVYAVVQPTTNVAVAEAEPNDVPASANSSRGLYFSGQLSGPAPSTDVDVYRVTAAAGDLIFASLDGDPTRDGTPVGLALSLLDASGNVLVSVNNSNASSSTQTFPGKLDAGGPRFPSEALTYRAPVAGDYFVRVFIGTAVATAEGAGDYLLSISRNCTVGGPAPVVTSLSPDAGTIDGGTTVTLTGQQFGAGATVRFGALSATAVTVVSDTEVTAVTPAVSLPGRVDVVLTNSDGKSVTRVQGFNYVAPTPTLVSVSPVRGPTTGGGTLSLSGTGYFPGATVTVGGVACTNVAFVSSTALSCKLPTNPAGPKDVTVSNVDGQSATLVDGYTYDLPAPTVTQISPTSGSSAGGTVVLVVGAGFQAGAKVRVGGSEATQVALVSGTQLSAVTPAGMLGMADVTVENPDMQTGTLAGAFFYVPPAPPTVASVLPATGHTTGGTPVTVTGTGFQAGASVLFGGVAGTNVAVMNGSSLTVSTPPRSAAGVVSVTVTNPDTQSGTLANGFTYVTTPLPTVSFVDPPNGPRAGGTQVTITGTRFENGAAVTFGGVVASDVNVVSVTSITARTPPRALAGAVAVVVTNTDGTSGGLPAAFTYDADPVFDAGTVDAGAGGAGGSGGSGGGGGAGGAGGTGGSGGAAGSGGSGGGGGMSLVDAGSGSSTAPKGCGCGNVEGTFALLSVVGLAWSRRRRFGLRG